MRDDQVKYGMREEMAEMPPGLVDWREGLYLSHVTRNEYRGDGEIVDAGSFLGGSAWALSQGLRHNLQVERKRARIHAFDKFVAWEEPAMTKEQTALWIRETFGAEVGEDGGFRDSFIRNLGPNIDYVEMHEGDLEQVTWFGSPIEVLFVDAAKTKELWKRILSEFYRNLIPGRSIVIHQDWHHAWLPHIVVTQEALSEYFELDEPRINDTASFRYRSAVPSDALDEIAAQGFSADEQISLMRRAIDRFSGFGADAFLRLAHVELLRSLDMAGPAAEALGKLAPEERTFADHAQYRRYLESRDMLQSRLSGY